MNAHDKALDMIEHVIVMAVWKQEETSNAAATTGWSVSRKPQPGDVTTKLLPTNRKG
jgi:hypothetical protein